jgi:hypothetical protein
MNIRKALTFLGWPLLLIPMLVLLTGAMMNEAAVWANGGQMPVSMYACQERMNPPASSDDEDAVSILFGGPKAQKPKDYVHKCADQNTKLRFLDDWIVSDEGISSIGDLLQESASTLSYVVYPLWLAGGIYFIFIRRTYYLD